MVPEFCTLWRSGRTHLVDVDMVTVASLLLLVFLLLGLPGTIVLEVSHLVTFFTFITPAWTFCLPHTKSWIPAMAFLPTEFARALILL